MMNEGGALGWAVGGGVSLGICDVIGDCSSAGAGGWMNWIGRGRGGREGGLRVDWYSYGGYEYAFFFRSKRR